jgi:hypothetical protein
MKKSFLFILLIVAVFLSGCANIIMARSGEGIKSEVENLGYLLEPKEENCEIVFYKDNKPNVQYNSIAKVKTHITINKFLHNNVDFNKDLESELKKQACFSGGDAVIIEEIMERSSGETRHIQA